TERRLLEVLATVAERTPLRIVPTFLGAHLLPDPGYLDLLVEEMLPACAPLAEGCDAFCDLGALTVAEARKALDAGVAPGLTPGTSYTTSMPFVIAVACSELRLSAEEAVRAATVGGAAALRRPDLGRLTVGSAGDLVVLAGESYVDLAYHPGMDQVAAVVAGGEVVKGPGSAGDRPG